MAKRQAPQNTSSVETNSFSKGMVKDIYEGIQPKEMWAHARNAANNSVDGDVGIIGNEPANLACSKVPYTIIGAIHKQADQWVIFSTDDINSEIGLFDDSKCEYTTLVNDPCLNFNRKFLITGAMKENYDCTWQVYFDDSNNPSRTLNIDDIPYVQVEVSTPGADCVEYEDTETLDCEKIRLAPLLETPCIKLSKSIDGGQLRNGSYQVYVAYSVNEQKVTDYIGVSNIQALFEHAANSGSLDIEVTNLDKEFEEYELVILSDNQGAKVAKKIGIYSTEQSNISIDFIDQSLTSVSLDQLFLRSPAYERSESMYVVNDYLIRQGPTEQFDFNYQPIANNITTQWVVAEYDSNYYFKGGNKTQFMRDEQYAFFIRWIYNTGEKSASYHIPGRAPQLDSYDQFTQLRPDLGVNSGINCISESGEEYNFQTYNTASIESQGLSITTDDGGVIISKGKMGYWQSVERYPNKPEIWGDLCGKPIRHHKMPTEELHPSLALSADAGNKIRILGVQFGNIAPPVFNDGSFIPNIVGYEILRGSREGAKSILGKGVFRNMRRYNIPNSEDTLGPKVGLYPNFPYNDLRADVYHYDGEGPGPSGSWTSGSGLVPIDPLPRTDGCDSFTSSVDTYEPLFNYERDVFTFHSPELMFKRPFLNPYETRIYGAYAGKSKGHFIKSEKHPQNKLLRNAAAIVAGFIGVGYAIQALRGLKKTTRKSPKVDIPNKAIELPIGGLGASGGGDTPGRNVLALAIAAAAALPSVIGQTALQAGINDLTAIGDLLSGGGATELSEIGVGIGASQAALTNGQKSGEYFAEFNQEDPASALPITARLLIGITLSKTQLAFGAQEVIDLMYGLVKDEDFAFKYNSHALLSEYYKNTGNDVFRRRTEASNYLGSSFQVFNGEYKVNNLNRPDTVILKTNDDFPVPTQLNAPQDRSRFTIGGGGGSNALGSFGDTYLVRPEALQTKDVSMLYGSLKFNFENQYGQLDGIKQVLMPNCVFKAPRENSITESKAIFTGDTYVGRYTEKVIMPFFTDFLLGQPDNYPYNYLQRINIPYPRYWMDTRPFDTTQLAEEIMSLGIANTDQALPNDLFYLDRGDGNCIGGFGSLFGNKGGNPMFSMRYGYMYTHCNGILDFFVESEVNLPNRDWEDKAAGRYYDPFRYELTDDLFNAEIIRDDNTYAYDYSLSASRFLTNLTSFGNIQPRDYDPEIAETCFTNYPKRLIYSLQAQEEAKKDFWRVFLPNNYRDFKDRVNIIKPINKNGAVIFFPYQSPQMFQGVDQLQTDLGTKITIGDGGLFSQPFQNLANSDLSNEYGSCESQRGVLNTPYGFFFISQAQGKIFQQSGQSLQAISNNGMKWWFNKYLPSSLIKQFPELEYSKLGDNPVIGVGCQVIFDINDDIVYFCKRDFRLKDEFVGQVTFDPIKGFVTTGLIDPPSVNPPSSDFSDIKQPTKRLANLIGNISIEVGDPLYFEDASWTVSYDPKVQAWISFHDWHPELCMSSINHFLTTKTEVSEEPICPPGYNYNSETRLCEKLIDETLPAVVDVDEVPAIIKPNEVQCLFDVVFAIDASGSAGSLTNPDSNGFAEVEFVRLFLENQFVIDSMANGTMQVGITLWGDNVANPGEQIDLLSQFGPTGQNMMSSITSAEIITLIQDNWPLDNGNNWATNLASAYQDGVAVIQNKASSELGDRTSQLGFKETFFLLPDGSTGIGSTTLGCDFQSSVLGGSGNSYSRAYGVYCFNGITPPVLPTTGTAYDALTWATCIDINVDSVNAQQYQFAIDAGFPAQITQSISSLFENFCQAPPTCECPEGYTLVYDNDGDGSFTDSESDQCLEERPPICRKVSCNCPAPPTSTTVTTETGECDNIYLTGPNGLPSYINNNPVICSYFELSTTEPSFIRGGIWRHNYRCDLFANYYDVDYPWEIELIESTGQLVNTVRSIEYQLESYVYKGDLFNGCGDDRWHDLDFNFDEAILYNSEQVSGLLRLQLDPKEDPINALTYPIIGLNDINILYSKVEQKYRFNQFWDITNDRGEFTNSEQQIFNTEVNGYIKNLNALNLNYNKEQTERKKFRHYYNNVLLRRNLSNNRKMLLKLANSKLNLSFR